MIIPDKRCCCSLRTAKDCSITHTIYYCCAGQQYAVYCSAVLIVRIAHLATTDLNNPTLRSTGFGMRRRPNATRWTTFDRSTCSKSPREPIVNLRFISGLSICCQNICINSYYDTYSRRTSQHCARARPFVVPTSIVCHGLCLSLGLHNVCVYRLDCTRFAFIAWIAPLNNTHRAIDRATVRPHQILMYIGTYMQ